MSSPTSPDTTSLAMNNGELSDSAWGRRRIEMANGLRLFAKENTWGSGFSRDGMACDNVGDNGVGGSYLKTSLTIKSEKKVAASHAPNTHNKNFVPLDREWTALEELRKFEETTTIASCAFWKDDNGSTGRASNVFEIEIIATRSVQGSTSSRHNDAQQRYLAEANNIRSPHDGFSGKRNRSRTRTGPPSWRAGLGECITLWYWVIADWKHKYRIKAKKGHH